MQYLSIKKLNLGHASQDFLINIAHYKHRGLSFLPEPLTYDYSSLSSYIKIGLYYDIPST